MEWQVLITHTKTGKVERCIDTHSERKAERIARGVSINLKHEEYHIEISRKAI